MVNLLWAIFFCSIVQSEPLTDANRTVTIAPRAGYDAYLLSLKPGESVTWRECKRPWWDRK